MILKNWYKFLIVTFCFIFISTTMVLAGTRIIMKYKGTDIRDKASINHFNSSKKETLHIKNTSEGYNLYGYKGKVQLKIYLQKKSKLGFFKNNQVLMTINTKKKSTRTKTWKNYKGTYRLYFYSTRYSSMWPVFNINGYIY